MPRIRIYIRPMVCLVVLTGLLSMSGCGQVQTPEINAGGPNMTMTALFRSIAQTESPIVTLPPTQPEAPTSAPSTPTGEPSPEATQVVNPDPTQAPTQAPTAPVSRDPVARAVFLSVPPIINGSLTDLGGEIYLINRVVYGAGNHSGEADASGRFLVSWDNQYLYLGVEARDDVYVQNTTGDQIYKGDCIELLLDVSLAADFQTTALNEDDYQLGLSPGYGQVGVSMENWLWFPRSKSGAQGGIVMAAQRTDNGYVLEAAIPWSIFGITPSAGQRYGFSVAVSDNDDLANNVQQSMVAFAPNRQLTNPTTWATLELIMP